MDMYALTKRCNSEWAGGASKRRACAKSRRYIKEPAVYTPREKMFTSVYEARLYEELLAGAGVVQQLSAPAETADPQCKGCRTEDPNDSYIDDGAYTCWQCGLVSRSREFVFYEPYAKSGQPLGAGATHTFERKRSYKSLTHFKEHLRRYMGARNGLYDVAVVDMLRASVDVLDPWCYRAVQRALKLAGAKKMYKEIFTLIYMLGGPHPKIDNHIFDKCVTDFMWLQERFRRLKSIKGTVRKNMPSMYVLLDILLRRNGHTPFYMLPYLKDARLQTKVHELFAELDGKHRLFRETSVDEYVDELIDA